MHRYGTQSVGHCTVRAARHLSERADNRERKCHQTERVVEAESADPGCVRRDPEYTARAKRRRLCQLCRSAGSGRWARCRYDSIAVTMSEEVNMGPVRFAHSGCLASASRKDLRACARSPIRCDYRPLPSGPSARIDWLSSHRASKWPLRRTPSAYAAHRAFDTEVPVNGRPAQRWGTNNAGGRSVPCSIRRCGRRADSLILVRHPRALCACGGVDAAGASSLRLSPNRPACSRPSSDDLRSPVCRTVTTFPARWRVFAKIPGPNRVIWWAAQCGPCTVR